MKMSSWLGPGLLLVAALVQCSVLPFVSGNRLPLNLVLVLVIGWAMLRGPQPALIWAILGGLWSDLLAGGPLGTAMLALSVVAYVCAMGLIPWFSTTGLIAAAVTAVGTLLYTFIYVFIVRTGQVQTVDTWWTIWQSHTVPAMVINALAAIPVFWLLSRFADPTPMPRPAP